MHRMIRGRRSSDSHCALITVLYYARRIARGSCAEAKVKRARRRERRREFMQTAGRRWQDSSLYADPLIPSRENPRARANLSVQHVSRLRHVKRGESEDGGARGKWDGLRNRGMKPRNQNRERNTRAPTRRNKSKSSVIIRVATETI